jgi:hypothetical protein
MKKLFILVLALVFAFAALPAFAQEKADWSFYGSVRMWTAWEQVQSDTPPQLSSQGAQGSFFQVGTTKSKAYTIGGNAYSDGNLAWLLQSNSRIGANVKWGNIGGAFEYGSTPYLRLLYGTWNFAKDMTFEIGQDYGSNFYLVSNMCGPGGAECNGIGFGSIYPGRVPMLRLIYGGLKVSLEQTQSSAGSYLANVTPGVPIGPTTQLLLPNELTAGTGFVQTDFQLPRFAASYTFNMGPGQFFVGGQYNQFKEIFDNAGSKQENTVYGWTIGAGTKLAFGPFYVNATVQYGYNPNTAGTGPVTLYPSVQLYDPVTDNAENSKYFAWQVIPGFHLTDNVTFEGGIIYQGGKVNAATVSDVSAKQNEWIYYVQMAYSPTKNMYIIPEAGLISYGKLRVTGFDDVTYGNLWYAGAKWQINF